MALLTRTSTLHLNAVVVSSGKPIAAAALVVAPTPAVLAAQVAATVGDTNAFIDASGLVLIAWPKNSGLDHRDFSSAWELSPYINAPYSHISINKAGQWYSNNARVGAILPAQYIQQFGQLIPA